MSQEARNRPANRLVHETSPYLLQHAYNPVDWYPWGEEALHRARSVNKPILLSIGYSACHWCHVMERESFEDERIAEIMNEHFICIKVDREERPDLDEIYMQATLALNQGQGGWPMTVFLTPEQQPIFAGTYFPPSDRWGRPGFATVLQKVAEYWRKNPEELRQQASQLTERLSDSMRSTVPVAVGEAELEAAIAQYAQEFDARHGGFGSAPKFPPATGLSFLLRRYHRTRDPHTLQMVRKTLDAMASGGLYDQIGGGFARYSTDQKWLVPHFEKMLYDNALLVQLYAELYQITGRERYLHVVQSSLDYVIREMTSPEGGFYSAQDADSDGDEGKFYTWSKNEIENALGDETLSDIFCEYYGVTQGGNFEGKNILNIVTSLNHLSQKYGKQPDIMEGIIKDASKKLFRLRENRVKPQRDNKILTAWNGWMISGFAKGYRLTNNKKYLDHALNAVSFIETKIANGDGRLRRTFTDGISKLNAYLE